MEQDERCSRFFFKKVFGKKQSMFVLNAEDGRENTEKVHKLSRRIHKSAVKVIVGNQLEDSVTGSFASFIDGIRPEHLSDVVHHRCKRMILDNIGVGLVGSNTHVFRIVVKYCQDLHFSSFGNSAFCSVYGQKGLKLSPT
ncbi:unnamed protein product, partial [Ranitomeya imitator]